MTSEERENMKHLCRLIQDEKDPDKFNELIKQLNDLLEQKELRLKNTPPN